MITLSKLGNETTDWKYFKIYLQNNIKLKVNLKTTGLNNEVEKLFTITQAAANYSTQEITYI